jgi:hypothetical protein
MGKDSMYNQPNERPEAPGDNQSFPLNPQARGARFQRVEGQVNVSNGGEQSTVKAVDTPTRNATPSTLK